MSPLRRCCSGPQEEMEMEQQQQLDEASNLLPVATPPLAASGDRTAMMIEREDRSVRNDRHHDDAASARSSSAQRQRPQPRRGLRANRRPLSRAHSNSSADIDGALQSMVVVAATSPGDGNSTNHRGGSGERKLLSAGSRLGAFLRRTTTPRRSNITKSGPTAQASGINHRDAKTSASSSSSNNCCPATHTAKNPGPVRGRRLTRPRDSSAVSSSQYKPAAAVAASGAPAAVADKGSGGTSRGESGTASASSSRRSVLRPFYRSKSAVVDRPPAPGDIRDEEDDEGGKATDSASSGRRRSVIRTFYRSKSAVGDRPPSPDDIRGEGGKATDSASSSRRSVIRTFYRSKSAVGDRPPSPDDIRDEGGKATDPASSSHRSVIRTFHRSKSAVVDRPPAPDNIRNEKGDERGKASGRRRHLSASHAAVFLSDRGRPGRREGGSSASNAAGRAHSSEPIRSSRPSDGRRAEEMPILDRASGATGSQAKVSRGTRGQNGGRGGEAHVVVAVSTKAAARDGGADSGIEYGSGISRVAGVPGQNSSEGLGSRLLPPAAAVVPAAAALRTSLKTTAASTVNLAPGSTHGGVVNSAAIGEHLGQENGIGEYRSDRDAPEAWRAKAERGEGKVTRAGDDYGNVSGSNVSQVRGKGSRSSKDLVLAAGGDGRVVSRAVDAPLAIDDDGRTPRRVASAAEGRATENPTAPAGGNATSTAFGVSPIANPPAEPSFATVAECATSEGLLLKPSSRKGLAELLHFRRRGSRHGIDDGSEGRASVLRSSILAAAVAGAAGEGKRATTVAINETVAAGAAMKARIWADTAPAVGGRRRSGRSVSPEKYDTGHDHDEGPSAGLALGGNSSRMGAQGSLTRMRTGQHGDVPLKGGVEKWREREDAKPGSGVRSRLARGSFGGRSYRSVVPMEMSWDDQPEEEPYQSTEAPSPRGKVEKGAPLKTYLQEAEADRHNGSASPWHSWVGGEASEFSVRTKGRGSTEVMSPSAPSLYELVGVDAFRSTSGKVRSVHPLFAPVLDSACRPLSGGEGVTVHPALVVSERKIPSGAGGGRADVEACGENRGASTASTSASASASTSASTIAWTSVVGGGEDTAALPGVASADTGHPDIPPVLVVNCPVVADDLEEGLAVHFVYVFRATWKLRRYAARLSAEERSLGEDKATAGDYGSGVTSLGAPSAAARKGLATVTPAASIAKRYRHIGENASVAGVFADRVLHGRDSGVEARDAEEEEEVPACVRLLAEWVRRSALDEGWRCRLRAVGEIFNTDEALRALNILRRFGGNEPMEPMEPILVCNDGAGASVVRREGFVEIDFENAHSFSSVNQKGLPLSLDEWEAVAFRVGFFIESRTEKQQPERMLGCAILKGLDVSALKELSFPPNGNLSVVGNPTAHDTRSDRGRGEMPAAPPIDPINSHHGGASSDRPTSSNGSEASVGASPEVALGTSVSPADVEGGAFFPPDAEVSSPAEAADTGIIRDISPREALAATAAADVLARVSEPLLPSSSASPSRLPLVHRPQLRVLLRCGESTSDNDDRMGGSPSGAEGGVVAAVNPHEVLFGGEPGAPQKETVTLTAVAAAAFAGGWFCAFLAMIIVACWSDLSRKGPEMEAGSSPLGVLGVWLLRVIRGAR